MQPNALAVALSAHRSAGRRVLDLTGSNPTAAGIPYDAARVAAALAEGARHPYAPDAFGWLGARETISALWKDRGIDVDPGRVALTSSTSEAYAHLLKLLCDPGDEVLVPTPSYPLFEHLVRYEGVTPVPYRIAYDGAFHLDLDSIRGAVTPRTRAVVVVTPNNPTGSIVKRAELGALATLGLPIISDEVFGEYLVAPAAGAARSVLEATDALVFALDGLSKLAGLPQMKLAWITVGGPAALCDPMLPSLELIADTYLSPGGPVQHALPHLLSASTEPREAIRVRIAENHRLLVERARGTAVTVLPLEGGWSAVLRLPGFRSEEEWTLGLLDEREVLVQPGWFYDFDAEPFVVLSLLTPTPLFDEGTRRLLEHVARAE